MKQTTKNIALLLAGVGMLAWCLRVVIDLLTGALPALSGATIGAVTLLLAGTALSLAALLRMGLLEVVQVEERTTGVRFARASSAGNRIG